MADPSVLRKFTSYLKDSETGAGQLNYATFREHSARIARFHMADPVQGRGSNPQRLNRYAYVRNDPTNRVDPRGLQEGDACRGGECIVQDVYNSGYPWSLDEVVSGAAGQYNRGPLGPWDPRGVREEEATLTRGHQRIGWVAVASLGHLRGLAQAARRIRTRTSLIGESCVEGWSGW